MAAADMPVLRVKNLKTYFQTDAGTALAVDGVSFDVAKGKTLALVGESGCGKSVTALSIMGLVPEPPGKVVGGDILLDGVSLPILPKAQRRALRGDQMTMIFQEPMTSLNPVFRTGDQIAAVLQLHRGMTKAEARAEAINLLRKVGIPAPESRVDDYPHQMSGGMRQRVMIAMAIACEPRLLIADEPTTALDVTIQAQVLGLLRSLQKNSDMTMLLITHDLGIVAGAADDVAVMYAGKIVETAPVKMLFNSPKHPYTQGLFASLPQRNENRARLHTIKGQVPAATHFPSGCRFHPRCPHAMDICKTQEPPLDPVDDRHHTACWLYDETIADARTAAP